MASITNPKQDVLKDYFGDVKILASYRDPRDLYIAARNLSGNDWVPKDPIIFVKWYKWYFERFNYSNNSNVLLIRFEDFVFKYEEISLKIRNFINYSVTQGVSTIVDDETYRALFVRVGNVNYAMLIDREVDTDNFVINGNIE